MKFLLLESQHNNLVKTMENILDEKIVRDSKIICEIKIYWVGDDENTEQEYLKYDVYVYLRENFLGMFNPQGFGAVKTGIKMRIKKYLHNIFGLEETEYFLGFSVKDCSEKK